MRRPPLCRDYYDVFKMFIGGKGIIGARIGWVFEMLRSRQAGVGKTEQRDNDKGWKEK
jgi:hypothetical protein